MNGVYAVLTAAIVLGSNDEARLRLEALPVQQSSINRIGLLIQQYGYEYTKSGIKLKDRPTAWNRNGS